MRAVLDENPDILDGARSQTFQGVGDQGRIQEGNQTLQKAQARRVRHRVRTSKHSSRIQRDLPMEGHLPLSKVRSELGAGKRLQGSQLAR